MRTGIIDEILRRIELRQPTPSEMRERERRRTNVARLLSEIAEPPERLAPRGPPGRLIRPAG